MRALCFSGLNRPSCRAGVAVTRAALAPSPAPAPPTKQNNATSAKVRYVEKPPKDDELYVYLYDEPPEGTPPSNMQHTEREVVFNDLRQAEGDFTLERNGFQLESFDVQPDIDWHDEKQVQQQYYPAVDALLKRVTGATRTVIFDHTLRAGQVKSDEEKKHELELEQRGQPVARVHVDYTTRSGVERLHMLLPDEAEKLQQTPFAVIQVWRPLRGPVDDSPLGMLDASSLTPDDYMSYTLYFPGRTGYNYTVHPGNHENHRWYYAKGIDVDEAYVFCCYHSQPNRARFTPHTGFKDPHTAPDAFPRQSVETRAYVFWENEEPQPIAREL